MSVILYALVPLVKHKQASLKQISWGEPDYGPQF